MKRKTLFIIVGGILLLVGANEVLRQMGYGGDPVDTSEESAPASPALEYYVLEKHEHLSKKVNKYQGFYMGAIHVVPPDTMSAETFARQAIEIAIQQQMGIVTFYSDTTCYQVAELDAYEYDEAKLSDCYLGQFDVSEGDVHWRDRLTPSAFKPHAAYWNQ